MKFRVVLGAACMALVVAVAVAAFAQQPAGQDYTARLETGVAFYAQKNYSEAAMYLETLARENPDRKEAFLWLGHARSHLKNWTAARNAYKRYAELAPDDAEGPRGVAVTYEAEGQRELATLWYQRAHAIEPGNAELKAAIARLGVGARTAAASPPAPRAGGKDDRKPAEVSLEVQKGFFRVGLAGLLGARSVWWGRLLALLFFTITLFNGAAMNGKMLCEKLPGLSPSVLAATTALGAACTYIIWWGIPVTWRWALLVLCVLVAMSAASFGARQAR